MHPLEKEVLKNCRANQLVKPGERVLVGVSGGPDSMAMMYAFAALVAPLKISLAVAHADHGLRPTESPREEDLVREHAELLGLECQVGRLPVREAARERRLSLEHAARELRYNFFNQVVLECRASRIAVAHNADDQAEEVLLRLIRGTGRKGLSGMAMIRDEMVVRPLLTISKDRILRYLEDKNIPFLIDSSNADRRYMRNRIRLDLLPRLAADFNSGIKQTLCQTATILQAEEEVLVQITKDAYLHTVSEQRDGAGESRIGIDLSSFTRLPAAIKRRVVERAFFRVGRRPGFRQIESLLKAAAGGRPHVVHLAAGLRAWRDGEFLRLSFPGGQTSLRRNFIDFKPLQFTVPITGPGSYKIPEINSIIEFEILSSPPNHEEIKRGVADYLDAADLSFPLRVRNRGAGDRFHPLGSRGSKKVGDFMTDLKMPPAQRDRVAVLLNGSKIIALLGVRIAHEFRITPASKQILKVTLRET